MDCSNITTCSVPANQGTICQLDGVAYSPNWYQTTMPGPGVQGWSFTGVCDPTASVTTDIQSLKFSVDVLFFALLAFMLLFSFFAGLKVFR